VFLDVLPRPQARATEVIRTAVVCCLSVKLVGYLVLLRRLGRPCNRGSLEKIVVLRVSEWYVEDPTGGRRPDGGEKSEGEAGEVLDRTAGRKDIEAVITSACEKQLSCRKNTQDRIMESRFSQVRRWTAISWSIIAFKKFEGACGVPAADGSERGGGGVLYE
jgi:hypothetical protein